MSRSTFPRTSYARKMYGFSLAVMDGPPSQDGDRLHLDEPLGLGEGRHRHERRRRGLLAEELLADGHEVGAMTDVGEVRVHLDDAVERTAPRLDLRLERLKDGARLRLEVARVRGLALRVVRDLPRDVEQGLGARDL